LESISQIGAKIQRILDDNPLPDDVDEPFLLWLNSIVISGIGLIEFHIEINKNWKIKACSIRMLDILFYFKKVNNIRIIINTLMVCPIFTNHILN
jgi:hypothetical protein